MAEPWKVVANMSGTNTFAAICSEHGLPYFHGCGFYELTKSEKVSKSKALVAMNEETSEIIDGSDAVRAKLNLGSGDVNISKSDIPKPWTLYVNSTSPNRGIPKGTTVLIRNSSAAGSSSLSAKRAAGTVDFDTLGADNDEVENKEDLRKHARSTYPLAADALKKFIAFSAPITLDGPNGDSKYIARGTMLDRLPNEDWDAFDWPHAFVGEESQPVFAAVWKLEDRQSTRLVAVYVLSTGGDETSVFFDPTWDEEERSVLEDLGEDACVPITNSDMADAFSVSSGDYPAKCFYCPALENAPSAAVKKAARKRSADDEE